MASEQSTSEELEGCREQRFLRQKVSRQESQVFTLRLAQRFRADNGLDTRLIDSALKQAEDELSDLVKIVGGSLQPRKKAKVDSSETCTAYIDECGSHSLDAKEDFGAFCLAAAIVRDKDLAVFEAKWKRWKLENLGSETKKVHEPDVRRRNGTFWFSRDRTKQDAALASLAKIIADLEYVAIVCVLHRDNYMKEHGEAAMDESLPFHGYLMTLHFIAERIAMALQSDFGGAKAHFILESRGPREDALMQYEFARLFLDGTTYLAPAYFRRQFFPGLQFYSKDDHVPGLEIADLIARPCGEKVIDPDSKPERWEEVRTKLCQGVETKHSILGLKITPWNDAYIDLWKS